MKKIISMLLAALLVFSFATVSFAADESSDSNTETTSPEHEHICRYCDAVFYDETAYQAHLSECSKLGMYCPACGKYYRDATEWNVHIDVYHGGEIPQATTDINGTYWHKTCPKCGREFGSPEKYNNHLDQNGNCNGTNALWEGLTIMNLIEKLIEVFDINSSQWEQIEEIVLKIVDFVQHVGDRIFGESDVEGAVDDLESKINGFNLTGTIGEYVANIITNLKLKIKALYAGEKATTVLEVEETSAEAPAETGSTSAGIAAFAAVTTACAAAYICTRKKEND